jgi:hypothetical protein
LAAAAAKNCRLASVPVQLETSPAAPGDPEALGLAEVSDVALGASVAVGTAEGEADVAADGDADATEEPGVATGPADDVLTASPPMQADTATPATMRRTRWRKDR